MEKECMKLDRNNYCKDCDRSIWGDKSCDVMLRITAIIILPERSAIAR